MHYGHITITGSFQMEDKETAESFDVEFTQSDQVDNKDSLTNVDVEERGSGDGEEDRRDGNSLPTQPTGTGDSLSLSSEGSESESLRSRVPRVNCPEHIVSNKLSYSNTVIMTREMVTNE